MPSHMQNSLIFHYNLKFYGDEADAFEKISLKRFVMQVQLNMRDLQVELQSTRPVVSNLVAIRHMWRQEL